MYSKDHKKKYLKFHDIIDEDSINSESEKRRKNFDLIITTLQSKINPDNIYNANNEVKLKIDNQESTRTSKNDDPQMNNFSNLPNKNIREKEDDISQDFASSQISENFKSQDISSNSKIDAEINLNNEIKNDLEISEHTNNTNENKCNIILSTACNNLNKKNILSRNKILNNNGIKTNSSYFDNSRYFLNKKTYDLIPSNKIYKERNHINKNLDKEKKYEEDNNKVKFEKENKDKKKYIINAVNINNVPNSVNNKKFHKKRGWRKRCRRENYITLCRDIFIIFIVVSAISFYATIFFL